MHRIDGPGATAENLFTEGDPAGGVAPTEVTADWLNDLQENVAQIVEGANIELSKGVYTQLRDAVLFPRSASETTAGVTPTNLKYVYGDIRRYGAQPDTDCTTAILNAVDSGHDIYIPPLLDDQRWIYNGAVIELNGSITDTQIMFGVGWRSAIEFQSGGIAWTGDKGKHKNFGRLRLIASGAGLTVLDIAGSTEALSPTRWVIDPLWVINENAAGGNVGISIAGGWIGSIYHPVVRAFDGGGIKIIKSGGVPDVSFNSLNFYGGEIQGNSDGVTIEGVLGLNFFGTAIEGNQDNGAKIIDGSRNILFSGCYFEANGLGDTAGANDIRIEASSGLSSIYSVKADNCLFLREAGCQNAIYANVCNGLEITPTCSFTGYEYNVYVDELASNVVKGVALSRTSASASIAHIFNDCNSFGQHTETTHNLNATAAAAAGTTTCPDVAQVFSAGLSKLGTAEIYYDATAAGDVRLQISSYDIDTGALLGTALAFTHTAIVGRNKASTQWNFGSRSMAGKTVAISVARLGGDAADTNANSITLNSMRVVSYETRQV